MNQKISANWATTKNRVKTIWMMNGSAPHTICGMRSSASSGEV